MEESKQVALRQAAEQFRCVQQQNANSFSEHDERNLSTGMLYPCATSFGGS